MRRRRSIKVCLVRKELQKKVLQEGEEAYFGGKEKSSERV